MSPSRNDAEVPQVDERLLLGLRDFRLSPWRALVQFGLFATVAALGLSMVFGQPPRPDIGWPIAIAGIVAAVVIPALTTVGGRQRVELFDEGFVVYGLFRTRQHRWSEVSDFALASVLPGRGMRQTYVVYDLAGDRGPMVALNRFLTGRGRALPIGLEPVEMPGNAVTVAVTMNAWRQRWLDSGGRESA